jgi:hypothetical protein
MVHCGPHQAMSDATPIARGNTPLTIPILTTHFNIEGSSVFVRYLRDPREKAGCAAWESSHLRKGPVAGHFRRATVGQVLT